MVDYNRVLKDEEINILIHGKKTESRMMIIWLSFILIPFSVACGNGIKIYAFSLTYFPPFVHSFFIFSSRSQDFFVGYAQNLPFFPCFFREMPYFFPIFSPASAGFLRFLILYLEAFLFLCYNSYGKRDKSFRNVRQKGKIL